MKDRSEIWTMMKDFRTCMVTTWNGEAMHSRPMAPHFYEEEGMIRFLSDPKSAKTDEIEQEHHINLTFANEGSNTFISLSATATQSRDRAMIKELWNAFAGAWFKGDAETADVVVITARPTEVSYWDGTSSSIVVGFELLKSKVTGKRPDLGDFGKTNLG